MTDTQNKEKQVKLCVKCDTVKSLNDEYYKAGKCYQKLCKICHNKRRSEWVNCSNKNYVKKKLGFFKLSEDLQEKIKYDIYVRINFKDISKKYPEVKYQSILRWNRKGIPKYKVPEKIVKDEIDKENIVAEL